VCEQCHRPLPSNVAVILREEDGTERPFGPNCARRLLGHPFGAIPNLTSAAILQLVKPKKSPPKKDPEATSVLRLPTRRTADQIRHEKASTYLLLRMKLLRTLPGVYYKPLEPPFQRFLEDDLTPADVDHVLNVEQHNLRNMPAFSLANLLTVYAFDRGISAALKLVPEDRRGFLLGMRRRLRDNLYLSESEVQGVAGWLVRIPNQPPLDANGFCWAWDDDEQD